mmetsp:Transcript_34790/g.82487  ORF Transcript_34790/g.82487 Transcript_34790/m.82487 type:complete len:237 (-) Transcript_34790:134-844(-)
MPDTNSSRLPGGPVIIARGSCRNRCSPQNVLYRKYDTSIWPSSFSSVLLSLNSFALPPSAARRSSSSPASSSSYSVTFALLKSPLRLTPDFSASGRMCARNISTRPHSSSSELFESRCISVLQHRRSAAWLYLCSPCSVNSLSLSTRFSRYSKASPHCLAVCPSKSSCIAMSGSWRGTHPRIAASTERSRSATTDSSVMALRLAALFRTSDSSSAMRNANARFSSCSFDSSLTSAE